MNSALAVPVSRSQKHTGEPYLKFQLAVQTPAVFSMRYVQEAIVLPTRRLTPMPNMPAPMLGLMNRRSRVFWVIDLAQMLGVSALDANSQQYTVILMQVGTVPIGLAVQKVNGIAWFPPDVVQSPLRQVTVSLVPYLRGCILHPLEKGSSQLSDIELSNIERLNGESPAAASADDPQVGIAIDPSLSDSIAQEIILVLDAEAIVQSPILRTH